MRKSRTARDAGLRTVGTATKWIAGSAVVLTGFLTVWEAHSVHDANATPAVAHQPASTSGGSGSNRSGGSSSGAATPGTSDPGASSGLQAPASVPAPSDRQPAASSGGS